MQVSQPYTPNAQVLWTTYTYDALGRTLTVVKPDGSTTHYTYQGNRTTVTDPAGRWKTFTVDGAGNLVHVTDPNPAGGTFETSYTYNLLNKLTQASMPRGGDTQIRTFTYDDGGRLLTATNPENGTVTYTYNSDGALATRTDAKSQVTKYFYDAYKRLTQVQHGIYYGSTFYEDQAQRVDTYYDINPFDGSYTQSSWGRIAAVVFQYDEQSYGTRPMTYMYSYTPGGLVTKKRMRVNRGNGNVDLDAAHTWDNEGRMASVAYPLAGPTYTYSYDTLGRPNKLTLNGSNSMW